MEFERKVREGMARTKRVLVIGLDSAPPPELMFNRFYDELPPNIRRLLERSVHGPMQTGIPAITIPMWMVMVTGKTPGELGLYGFRHRRGGNSYTDYWIAHSKKVKEKTLWDHLGGERGGKRSVIVGVPPTYPQAHQGGAPRELFHNPRCERRLHISEGAEGRDRAARRRVHLRRPPLQEGGQGRGEGRPLGDDRKEVRGDSLSNSGEGVGLLPLRRDRPRQGSPRLLALLRREPSPLPREGEQVRERHPRLLEAFGQGDRENPGACGPRRDGGLHSLRPRDKGHARQLRREPVAGGGGPPEGEEPRGAARRQNEALREPRRRLEGNNRLGGLGGAATTRASSSTCSAGRGREGYRSPGSRG